MSVSERLEQEHLVRSKQFFYYLGRLSGQSSRLKAGEYELNTKMSSWEVLTVITGSHVKLHRITIPEGSTMFQIARLLEEQNLVDERQFLETCWDRAFLDELMIPSFSAEGYLFPETYFIPRGSSPKAIVRMLVDMFWSQVPVNVIEQVKIGSLSFHESLTMASIIEKETGLAGEMRLISSVFHNRIKKRMKIQSDPTAIYDLLPYGGRVTRDHLFRKSPYNTYQTPGLPIGPISNPSAGAIYAAVFPERTDFLYFVSRRDGSHEFTSNYDDHKRAINKFLK